MAIFDRLATFGGTDVGQALGSAHDHFQTRLNTHGHFGRALIESIAQLSRNHPNLVGIAVGVLVEQLLVHEKHHHDLEQEELRRRGLAPEASIAPLPRAAPHDTPHHLLRFSRIHPGRIAMEVFGALILLKFTTGIARVFSRNHKRSTLGSMARIHLFSATFGTYFVCKALKSHEVSALRNGLAAFFATRALKPLMRPDFRRHLDETAPPRAADNQGFSLAPELHPPEQGSSAFH